MSKFNLRLRKGHQIKMSNGLKANYEGGRGYQVVKTTLDTSGKKHIGKFLACTSGFFGCRMDDLTVRDSPTIAARGKVAKQVTTNALDGGAPKRNDFYAL